MSLDVAHKQPTSGWRSTAGRLRRRLGTGAVLATTVLAVAACGSSNSSTSGGAGGGGNGTVNSDLGTRLYGTLPPVGTPKPGGTVTQGQLTGQTPTYIFPIAPGAQTSTGTISFLSSLFMPLYGGPTGARPQVDFDLSAANPPKFTDGDKTVTIPIKPGLKWTNGAARRRQRRRLLV